MNTVKYNIGSHRLKRTMKWLSAAFFIITSSFCICSCSDSYMEDINTDDTKTLSIDPNAQLTTCLLQTYGDFGLMDTYRSYITGFTQHLAGGWNVSNYAGSVHFNDDQTRLIWDQYYNIALKNLRDAIVNSAEKPNLNAVLRIHTVYLLSVLTDTYGDIPCLENIGKAPNAGTPTPRFDRQEDIYNFFFEELKSCVAQLGTGNDPVTGDATNYDGDTNKWKKYANSLRLRFAMRISDVNPEKAQAEFEAALQDEGKYIASSKDDAYIRYQKSPFTLYDGSREYDFRVNALGEILYGQDPTSPSFVCATLYNKMLENKDPRLYKICRHYLNLMRSEINPDNKNFDLTDEVLSYLLDSEVTTDDDRFLAAENVSPCKVGAAWWNNWINGPSEDVVEAKFPTLYQLCLKYPEAGLLKNNFPARLMRPFLSIDFCQPDRPGVLITYAEVELLLAEAKSKGWDVSGTVEDHYKKGTEEALMHINKFYLAGDDVIADTDISTYVNNMAAKSDFTDAEKAREAINLQAWILHLMNPAEGWANLRRSDYPVLANRADTKNYPRFTADFTYDDDNLTTPVRLCYPILEKKYNSVHYQEALDRMGGKDDWHHPLWWDKNPIHVE